MDGGSGTSWGERESLPPEAAGAPGRLLPVSLGDTGAERKAHSWIKT